MDGKAPQTIGSQRSPDPVLSALDDLVTALRANIEVNQAAIERVEGMKTLRVAGQSYRQIAETIGRPLAVEMITENIDRLLDSGAALRRAHAKALHEEGLTMDRIARLFGVTRQRISAIMRSGQ